MWYSTPLQFVLCDTITMRMRMREYISHTHVKHYYLPHPARVTNAASFNPAMKRSTKSITLIGHYYRSNSWNDQSEVSICVSIRSNIFYQCVCLFDRSNIFINRCVYSIEYILSMCVSIRSIEYIYQSVCLFDRIYLLMC